MHAHGSWLPLVLPLAALLSLLPCAAALSNGAARLPPLGWNSWCAFGPCATDVCTEGQALASIAAMETNGMQAAGYNYVSALAHLPRPLAPTAIPSCDSTCLHKR